MRRTHLEQNAGCQDRQSHPHTAETGCCYRDWFGVWCRVTVWLQPSGRRPSLDTCSKSGTMKLPAGYVPGLLQQHKATAKGGFGERLLRQYGWTEGKGLGANETGIAEALRVKQKKDQTGVSCTLLLLAVASFEDLRLEQPSHPSSATPIC